MMLLSVFHVKSYTKLTLTARVTLIMWQNLRQNIAHLSKPPALLIMEFSIAWVTFGSGIGKIFQPVVLPNRSPVLLLGPNSGPFSSGRMLKSNQRNAARLSNVFKTLTMWKWDNAGPRCSCSHATPNESHWSRGIHSPAVSLLTARPSTLCSVYLTEHSKSAQNYNAVFVQ